MLDHDEYDEDDEETALYLSYVASGLFHHCVPVDVRQQTEAEPGKFGLEDMTSRSILMMVMLWMRPPAKKNKDDRINFQKQSH